MTNVFAAGGVSVFETMSRLAAELGAVNLGQGFPEGLEPDFLIDAAAAAMRTAGHQYPPMMGIPALRQAVAAANRRDQGIDTDWRTEVLVTSGATEALADCFLGLLQPGDEVIVLEPAYDSYQVMIRRVGAVPVPVRLEPPDWDLPRAAVEAAIGPKNRVASAMLKSL